MIFLPAQSSEKLNLYLAASLCEVIIPKADELTYNWVLWSFKLENIFRSVETDSIYFLLKRVMFSLWKSIKL